MAGCREILRRQALRPPAVRAVGQSHPLVLSDQQEGQPVVRLEYFLCFSLGHSKGTATITTRRLLVGVILDGPEDSSTRHELLTLARSSRGVDTAAGPKCSLDKVLD